MKIPKILYIIPILLILFTLILSAIPINATNYTQITQKITASANDGTSVEGVWNNETETISLGIDATFTRDTILRFQLNANQGDIVQDAKIKFTAGSDTPEGLTFKVGIRIELSNNAITIADNADIATRTWSGVYHPTTLLWYGDATNWSGHFTDEEVYYSADISRLINVILARTNFVTGNYINIRIQNNTGESYGNIYTYDGDTSKCPELQYKIVTPSVITLGADYRNPSKVILQGLLYSLGTQTLVYTGFEYGTSTDYGNIIELDPRTKAGYPDGLFETTLTNLADDVTYHYRAFIRDSAYNYYYGSDKEIPLGSAKFAISTGNASNISYNSAMIYIALETLGQDSQVDLSIDYGTTSACASNAVVSENETDIDLYYIELSGLTGNTTYYYRAKGIGDVSGTLYGKTLSFTTWDPNSPKIINQAGNFFSSIGFTGDSPWWIILLLLIAITWILLHKYPIMAIMISLLLIGLGIMLSIIDVWLIVLLTIGAGLYTITALKKITG